MPKGTGKGVLDHDFIRKLMKQSSRRRMSQKYVDIAAIHNLLEGTFVGTIGSIAETLGINEVRVSRAIAETRKTKFKQEAGWTIPFVPMGPGAKEWRIAKTKKDHAAMYLGNRVRNMVLRNAVETLKSHFEFERQIAPTRIAKERANSKALYMRHVEELMELDLNGR